MEPNLRDDIVNATSLTAALKEKYGNSYKFIDFKAKVGSEKGDNFIGDLIECEVKVEDTGSHQEKTLHWMCKVMKRGKSEEMMKKLDIFHREEAFYKDYQNDLEKYLQPDLLRTAPLIYSLNEPDKQILVFEHLGYRGFRDPINKRSGLDKDHVECVLKWMAELHGTGYLLFKKYPGGHESWKKNNFFAEPIHSDFFDSASESILQVFYDNLSDLKNGSSKNDAMIEDFITKIKAFFNDLPEGVTLSKKSRDLFYESRTEFKTLIHGDPWFNNMLFKYEDDGSKLLDVILLDMQVVYSGNIGSDLAYFFLSSVAYDNLSENLDGYIETYRNSIVEIMSKLNPDAVLSLSLEDIKVDFFKSSLLGLFFSLGVFPNTLVDKDDMCKVDLSAYDWSDPQDIIRYSASVREHNKKLLQTNPLLYDRQIGVIRFLTDIKFENYCKY
eukprot:TRINITY_DN4377_c0_g1_i1.p1 TRINITY_DN4377_c0_g1~~TRINITY_DN4377_c0_g1_i1.p1  ORF type:complete len:441 (+),score=54.64 TRINITY_DN4377_c0_g1_i1:151-1473(+)